MQLFVHRMLFLVRFRMLSENFILTSFNIGEMKRKKKYDKSIIFNTNRQYHSSFITRNGTFNEESTKSQKCKSR